MLFFVGPHPHPTHTHLSASTFCARQWVSRPLFPRAQAHQLHCRIHSYRYLFLPSNINKNSLLGQVSAEHVSNLYNQQLGCRTPMAPPPLSLSFLTYHKGTIAVTTSC